MTKMKKNKNTELAPFIARKAIVLYDREAENNRDYYAEVHQIEQGHFLEGRPLTIQELKEFKQLAEAKKNDLKQECYPYRHILGFSINLTSVDLVWIYPAGKVKLHYSKEAVGYKTGHYFVPNLLFSYSGDDLSVFAIKTADIPFIGPNTKLYKAPFMNIYAGGDICMGTAQVKKPKNITELISNVESAFFNSEFTHTNRNKIVKGNLREAYENQKKCFDEELLLPHKTLKEVISKSYNKNDDE